jgi:hypothetical protein
MILNRRKLLVAAAGVAAINYNACRANTPTSNASSANSTGASAALEGRGVRDAGSSSLHEVDASYPLTSGNLIAPYPYDVPEDESVIVALRPKFRACYGQGLGEDSRMQGKLTIDATLDSEGKVTSASSVANNGLSAAVAKCIEKHVRSTQFTRSDQPSRPLKIPITFVPTK